MTDPQTFYNREDLWNIAQETYADRTQQMQAYYTTLRLPGESTTEFASILPFTPSGQNRNNMLAWMWHGPISPTTVSLLVYRFPQGKLVFGPQQIEARINQEPAISSQVSLWNQQGSQVLRGTSGDSAGGCCSVRPAAVHSSAEQSAAGAEADHRRLYRRGGESDRLDVRSGTRPGTLGEVLASAAPASAQASAEPQPNGATTPKRFFAISRPPLVTISVPPRPPPAVGDWAAYAPRWPPSTSCWTSSPPPPPLNQAETPLPLERGLIYRGHRAAASFTLRRVAGERVIASRGKPRGVLRRTGARYTRARGQSFILEVQD